QAVALEIKDEIKRRLGLAWKPKPKSGLPPPFKIRNQFFGETLQWCRYKGVIAPEWFNLLINDLRPRGTHDRQRWGLAHYYGKEFGISPEAVDEALASPHRTFKADERGRILGVTYAERQLLGLRPTGCIDVDKEERERARRDRYNIKRRVKREA